ncbi:hypothetical protein EV195_101665 [Tenacibaculum skagerrakense]|uniref:TonB-dependent receptor-like protein n=1 Tax=Tenacibaculum skagerrakense TaxID=186571 RepID=A0A4R2P1T3_9FLAO|nr:hypothetical protein [Tenacibaculum skagerrakense]TCP28487.1 hypothetical protein EV195_101665 [Tenacibaculum skagerrakense]
MKKNYILTFFLLVVLSSFAQEKTTDEKYQEYFENTREIPFLHLNKTSFLQGEEIWFKAYIQEQNSQKLHPTTTNLYVSVFNENASLIKQKLIHITNGIGRGSFLLDSTYTDKEYYLKASTKWMKNFKEDNAYYQKIKLIRQVENQEKITANKHDFYEFKLFPEGGHYVANTLNNIGVLIKDYKNQGVKIQKGIIKDQNGNAIRHFNTNSLGMNSVRLFLRENDVYTFYAILDNGSEIEAVLPKPEPKGFSLIVNSKNPKSISLNIITNQETLNDFSGKQYRVLVHNTRSYRNFLFTLDANQINYGLILKEQEVDPGINIITVFNDQNQPISERIIFVKSDDLFQNIKISNTKKIRNDSITVKFTNPSKEEVYLSASFLPENTQAYHPNNNIISSFLLKPYVKGDIQNAMQLLGKPYKGQERDLDLLLLTQGWSKYNWNSIFTTPPATDYTFENGIDLTLRLNKRLTSKQSIVLTSKENNLIRIINPTENPWILKNSFIKKNSTLKLGLSSNGNYFKVFPAISYSSNSLLENIDISQFPTIKNLELEVSNFKSLKSEFEDLNEVEVTAIRNRRKTKNQDNIYGGVTMLTSTKMDNIIIASGETVVDFIRSKNYSVLRNEIGDLTITLRGINSLSGSNNSGLNSAPEGGDEFNERFGRPAVRVFLDGEEISQSLWMLEMIYLNTVKEIFYGRDPSRFGEQIHIYRLNPTEYIDKRANFSNIQIPVGFATEKEYYNPIYPSFTNETYKKYGSVFWEPIIDIEANSTKNVKVPLNTQKKIKIHLEGITKSGKLISQEVILSK